MIVSFNFLYQIKLNSYYQNIKINKVKSYGKADDSPSPSSPPHQTIGEIICLGKCALKCKRFFRIKPLYAGCVASCALLKCHKVSSKVAYDCATNCVISKSNNFNTGNYIFSVVLYDFFCYQDNFINYCCMNY